MLHTLSASSICGFYSGRDSHTSCTGLVKTDVVADAAEEAAVTSLEAASDAMAKSALTIIETVSDIVNTTTTEVLPVFVETVVALVIAVILAATQQLIFMQACCSRTHTVPPPGTLGHGRQIAPESSEGEQNY